MTDTPAIPQRPSTDTTAWRALMVPHLETHDDEALATLAGIHIQTAKSIRTGHCPGVRAIHERLAAGLGIAWDVYAATLPRCIKPRTRRRQRVTQLASQLGEPTPPRRNPT